MFARFTALSLLCTTLGVLGTQELNSESFAKLTAKDYGKNGMIKFFQPWCGHCTSMKPDWDRLADNVDTSVFIADVNCSDEADVCEQVGVKGYPTIKVYQDGKISDYSGARTFDALMEYVDENLAVKCKIDNTEVGCSEKAIKYIGKWKTKDAADVTKELQRLEGMTGKSMAAELQKWLRERIAVLRQIAPQPSTSSSEGAEEL